MKAICLNATTLRHLGGVTKSSFRPTAMGNSMSKFRRPTGRPNFNMELPILVGWNPNIITVLACSRVHYCSRLISVELYINISCRDTHKSSAGVTKFYQLSMSRCGMEYSNTLFPRHA